MQCAAIAEEKTLGLSFGVGSFSASSSPRTMASDAFFPFRDGPRPIP
jgi:hypothetical protein